MKYVFVMIIAISFSGSQAWARTNWSNVKTCDEAAAEKKAEKKDRYQKDG